MGFGRTGSAGGFCELPGLWPGRLSRASLPRLPPEDQLERTGPGSRRRAGRVPGRTRRLPVRRRSPENLLIRQGQCGSGQSEREGAGRREPLGRARAPRRARPGGAQGRVPNWRDRAGGTWGAFPPSLAGWALVRLGPQPPGCGLYQVPEGLFLTSTSLLTVFLHRPLPTSVPLHSLLSTIFLMVCAVSFCLPSLFRLPFSTTKILL